MTFNLSWANGCHNDERHFGQENQDQDKPVDEEHPLGHAPRSNASKETKDEHYAPQYDHENRAPDNGLRNVDDVGRLLHSGNSADESRQAMRVGDTDDSKRQKQRSADEE